MNGEEIFTATDYFHPFPRPEDVFADNVEQHPLTSRLPGTQSHLTGLARVQFLIPIEPIPGFGGLGDDSASYHNYLCRPNWVAYEYHGNGCRLACDFRFFHKEYFKHHPTEDDIQKEEIAETPEHYAETRRNFEATEQHFREYGWVCSDALNCDGSPYGTELPAEEDWGRASLVCRIGGKSFYGNWSFASEFPCSQYPDKYQDDDGTIECDRVLPQTEDGRDFHFIGELEMWNYIGYTNGVVVLFYDPQTQIALSGFDWT